MAPYNNSTGVGFQPIPSDKVSRSFKAATCQDNPIAQWKRLNSTYKYRNYEVTNQTMCLLQFTVPHDLNPPVFLYYRLTNFYQNHRRYVKSLDTNQLRGDAVSGPTIAKSNCDPLKTGIDGKPYYPCGLIANSLFNDTFNNPILLNVGGRNQMNQTYDMTNEGIAWDSDKALYGPTKYKPADIAVPPNWREQYPEDTYSEDHPPPNLETYEEFQVWMRTAGLPAFSKLARRNDTEKMQCGVYQLNIVDSRCHGSTLPKLLTRTRLQRHHIRRHQIHPHLDQDGDGGQEPVPGHCVHCCGGDLYPSWRPVHGHSSDQATVGYNKRMPTESR